MLCFPLLCRVKIYPAYDIKIFNMSYTSNMRSQLEYVGKALLLELIAMLVPCMVLWFHTGNSRGLQEEDLVTADKVQILVDNKGMDVETFLIHAISVDYQPKMETEALKALAVAARSHVYAHLKWYSAQQEHGCEVEADQLGVAYQTPAEMAYALQQADPERHWSELYQEMKKAVKATSGQYLIYSGSGQAEQTENAKNAEPVDVMWHDISAGNTRFYKGNQTGEDDGISIYSPEQKSMDGKDSMLSQAVKITVYTRRQLAELLWEISGTEKILEEGNSLSAFFKIEERDDSGYIKELSIGNQEMTGDEAAQLLQVSSGCFYVSDRGDSIKIVTFGTGTGYGMSLAGASVMASQGADYQEILEYYFPMCQIE